MKLYIKIRKKDHFGKFKSDFSYLYKILHQKVNSLTFCDV